MYYEIILEEIFVEEQPQKYLPHPQPSHMLTIIFIHAAYIQEEVFRACISGINFSGTILEFCIPHPMYKKHRNAWSGKELQTRNI